MNEAGEKEGLGGSEDQGEQLRAKETVTVGVRNDIFDNALIFDDHSEDLVPGLPNVIILDLIVPKLPWRTFHSLSSVSRCWRHAIRSRQVYKSRVRSYSTETLFAMEHVIDGHIAEHSKAISLYSAKDDSWHRLPQLPDCPRGIPAGCKCISLDGKLYLIGGDTSGSEDGSRQVYVLDLVEQREWKQCASMQEPRIYCEIGVVSGKIYAFGGMSLGDEISGSEVYDPKENVWSSIRPMKAKPLSHTVLTIGEELFVCGGSFWEGSDDFARMANGPDGPACYGMFSEVYHPGKDEWRLVKRFGWCDFQSFFMAEGELYGINYMGIRVADIKVGGNSWTVLHSSLFPGIEPADQARIRVFKARAVNGELLALVDWCADEREFRILKSKGFRSGNANIVWENVSCPLSFYFIPFMCPIQL